MGGGGISSRIYLESPPNKLDYIEGEQLDLSGMIIKFKDGESEPQTISQYKTIPSNSSVLTKHNNLIVIEYDKDGVLYKEYLPIHIKYPVDFNIDYIKSEYNNGDNLDFSTVKASIVYNDGSIGELSDGITFEPESGTVFSNQEYVKLTYSGISKYVKLSKNTKAVELRDMIQLKNIYTFNSATIEQFNYMMELAYKEEIDLEDYWKVGDYREFNFLTFNGTNIGSSYSSEGNFRNPAYSKLILKIVDFKRQYALSNDTSHTSKLVLWIVDMDNIYESMHLNANINNISQMYLENWVKVILHSFNNNECRAYKYSIESYDRYWLDIASSLSIAINCILNNAAIESDQSKNPENRIMNALVKHAKVKCNNTIFGVNLGRRRESIYNAGYNVYYNIQLHIGDKTFNRIFPLTKNDVIGDNAFKYFKNKINRAIGKKWALYNSYHNQESDSYTINNTYNYDSISLSYFSKIKFGFSEIDENGDYVERGTTRAPFQFYCYL